jgi:predicted 3-demethylubiquinone-9 3-methyltransferase (glyoxalase superfamily)
MQTITPFLWFDTQAEEAARFYVSIFKNSRIGDIARGEGGKAFVVGFELDGVGYTALNGGPTYKLTEAFSLQVACADQAEIDDFWSKLTSGGGESGRCGWLKDRFGLSWQIVPANMGQLVGGDDPAKAQRATQAMMQMSKLDIAALQAARDG